MSYNKTGDKMIRIMTRQELREIYQDYMIDDFPDDERKPLSIIESRFKKNQNHCLVYLEDDVMKGYAILESCQKSLLMDYFAVIETYRNQGTGTRFLHEMKQYFSEFDALFVESECAYDEISQKRLDFYQKAGFVISGIQVHLYHVDYEVMTLSLNDEIETVNVRRRMEEIYEKIYPKSFRSLFLKWK